MNATHLVTMVSDDGLTGMWGLDQWRTGSDAPPQTIEIDFRRTVMGLDFTPPAHAVVVGEREHKGTGVARSWVALDETVTQTQDLSGDDLVSSLITLKDRHLVDRIFVNAQPADMAEHVRAAAGLTHYPRDLLPQERSLKWPTYRSEDATAAVIKREVPQETLMHDELDRWLRADVKDPISGRALFGRDGMPFSMVTFLDDFPTQMCQQSMRIGSGTPAIALWLALKGLETTQRKVTVENELRDNRHPDRPVERTITGY